MKTFDDEVHNLLAIYTLALLKKGDQKKFLKPFVTEFLSLIRARLDSCETQEISIGTTKPEWGDAILVSDLHRAFGLDEK